MSRNIDDLDEPFRSRVRTLLADLDRVGVKYAVTETRRSYTDQAAYFAKGTSKCDGIRNLSMHQAGLAVDIVPLDSAGRPTWDYRGNREAYMRIAAMARAVGLEVGQDWLPIDPATGMGWDPPHIQFKG